MSSEKAENLELILKLAGDLCKMYVFKAFF